MSYNRSTDLTNGEGTFSAGRQRTNYAQHFVQEPTYDFKRHSGTLILSSFGSGRDGFSHMNQVNPSNHRTELSFSWSGTGNLTTPDKKKLVTCLAAFIMPTEGVDENLESTLEILRFYCEQAGYEALSLDSPPTQVTGVIGEVKQRPPMVLGDC